jgi:hypothetical protein
MATHKMGRFKWENVTESVPEENLHLVNFSSGLAVPDCLVVFAPCQKMVMIKGICYSCHKDKATDSVMLS